MIHEIYFAAGCFWGAEKYFSLIPGVVGTEVGYANGNTPDPTYEQVYTDGTGYAETVHVSYDDEMIALEKLVRLYFKAIDPTSLNRQGEDRGTRYRTGIYYSSPADLDTIRKVYTRVRDEVGAPLAVELLPLKNFYQAESEHQDYLITHPGGYCHIPEALFELARSARPDSEE